MCAEMSCCGLPNRLLIILLEVLSTAANFCYSCGKELNEKADEPKPEISDD